MAPFAGRDGLDNSGCNDSSGVQPFQHLAGAGGERLLFCGHGGRVVAGTRDTDWFTIAIGSTGVLEWTMDAEQPGFGFLIGPQDCDSVAVQEVLEAGPCQISSLTLTGEPDEVLWLWVSAVEFSLPGGFQGHEFLFSCEFQGLADGIIATEGMSLDRIKSLYRK
jgi:hypothetical protein